MVLAKHPGVKAFFLRILFPRHSFTTLDDHGRPHCHAGWRVLAALALSCFGSVAGPAGNWQSVELSWTDSPDPNVVAYKVYFDTQGGPFTGGIYYGDISDVTIPGFEVGVTYYFAVSALDAAGDESKLSNVVGYGNGDGHDVEVHVPLDASMSRAFFRVVQ